ncbi:hypothetical protein KIPB_002930 [Kipferlia bialata]|uniref:Saposin B-type domain-containing protein n=1 Tax=Kipferlia bialata TaxID=797122 RepID=A0A391NSS2_9EUKA|nr:hypothetical protein KIPB_002930 [Kipferlia bialata]|eukprot:g2930.t1
MAAASFLLAVVLVLCTFVLGCKASDSYEDCDVCYAMMEETEHYMATGPTEEDLLAFVQTGCCQVLYDNVREEHSATLASEVQRDCLQVGSRYGKDLMTLLLDDYSPDVVCSVVGVCH